MASRPRTFRSREPHIIYRILFLSTPCANILASERPTFAGLPFRRLRSVEPVVGGARILHPISVSSTPRSDFRFDLPTSRRMCLSPISRSGWSTKGRVFYMPNPFRQPLRCDVLRCLGDFLSSAAVRHSTKGRASYMLNPFRQPLRRNVLRCLGDALRRLP